MHNHPPDALSLFPAHRKVNTPVKAAIDGGLNRGGEPKQAIDAAREINKNLKCKDVYNYIHEERNLLGRGITDPWKALEEALKGASSDGVKYIARKKGVETVAVFLTSEECVEICREYTLDGFGHTLS